MTAICASHYRNPLNDYVGKKHHHKNRFRQRQSSRSAFYQPGLKVIESHSRTIREETSQSQTQSQPSDSISNSNSNSQGHWGFRPSALQYKDYGKGDMSVSEIVDCYVRDNERAEQEGVSIPPRPTLKRRLCHKHVRDALFSASSKYSNTTSAKSQSQSLLRCLQWNIQAFLSPKDERNMHTITAGIIRSICETDSDVLILNEIHWREMENHNPNTNTNLYSAQQAIQNSQALLEEVLRLRGYHYSIIANHGDTPTMVATRKKVLRSKEVVLSCNRSALCLLIQTDNYSKCWIVGTHLDAFDANLRRREISRLLQEPTSNIPVLIAGDFNQQRSKDYTPSEWRNVASSADLRGVPLDDGVSSILESSGFQCVLDTVQANHTNTNANMARVQCNWNQSQPPPSTHWSGTIIDYTYFSNPHNPEDSPTLTTIAPHGVYVGSAGFSDHRMTVTDWKLTSTTCNNTTKENPQQQHKPRHIDKSFFFHHLPEGRHHSWLYSYHHRNQYPRNETK